MRFSIRSQILLPLFVLLLGVVGISTWTGIASAERARRQVEEDVRNVTRTLSEKNFPLKPGVLQSMNRLSGADFVLLSPTGRIAELGKAATLDVDPELLPQKADLVDDWHTVRLESRVKVGDGSYLCTGIRLRDGSTLYILYSEALWQDALWTAVQPSLILGVFGGLAALIMAVLLSQRLGRRIQELERRTRLIASGDFSPMPLPSRNDELRDLGLSINEMAQRLTDQQEALKQTERLQLLGQVSGGLAHQLRNGVTGARLAVQLHARQCNGQGDAEALEVALRQLALVETNLKQFLDQGRVETLRREKCNLIQILNDVADQVRPQCRHAHIELNWQPAETEVIVEGDAGQLSHLLFNIIHNGVEAAGPNGLVQIRCRANGGPARVEVLDSGPGPPPEVADRLFDLFVTAKREGVGLGLAVARQVAKAHGGSINWRREDSQTCFCIELPQTPNAEGK